MFADKKSANYSIQQIGIYRKSTEKNFLFWYSNWYKYGGIYAYSIFFLFYMCNSKYHNCCFHAPLWRRGHFFCIYMSVIVRLKKVNSLNVLLSFVIIIFTYLQSLFYMTCFFLTASMGVSEGKPVGSWFGPNTVAQVLK